MLKSPFRRRLVGALMSVPVLAPLAAAQSAWPNRVVKLVVSSPAGGGVDLFARGLAERLSAALGQTMIVDNKPGAGSLLGTKAVAQSAPDGYTLGYLHSGLVTQQAMNAKIDLLKEFRLVAKLSSTPFMLVVRADSPYQSTKDLIAAVRANPGKLSYGSGGVGSPAHLAVEQLADKVGNFNALHVPFKGAVEAAQAMMGGQIDFIIGLLGAVAPLVQGGKLRALAITSKSRLPLFANVPTMAEAGIADFVFEPWGGLVVPAGTPDNVVARLNEVLPDALASQPVKELIAKQGGLVTFAGPQAFSAQIARELEIERALVKRLGLLEKQ
ncbi:MAG TPA: tripartite tricarboxylate transporter substrate binding protein [Casimicrobium sp.]|nr:tripartite tricarboxylate transporter substrate binding protein [Casimicrobium sp.]